MFACSNMSSLLGTYAEPDQRARAQVVFCRERMLFEVALPQGYFASPFGACAQKSSAGTGDAAPETTI
jgi:hypothetical protein